MSCGITQEDRDKVFNEGQDRITLHGFKLNPRNLKTLIDLDAKETGNWYFASPKLRSMDLTPLLIANEIAESNL